MPFKKVPYHRKDRKVKDRTMLSRFLDDDKVEQAINGTLIGEEQVETVPLKIPSSYICVENALVDTSHCRIQV